MKMIPAAALIVAGLASIPAHAATESRQVASPGRASIFGTWKLDTGSMAAPVEARPASVTAIFVDAGGGMWNTTYAITGRDGSVRRMTSRERLDGRAVPIEGDNLDADSVAMTSPAPGVLVMALAKDRRPASTRVYTVAADGSAMTEIAVSVGDDGVPVVRSFRWVR